MICQRKLMPCNIAKIQHFFSFYNFYFFLIHVCFIKLFLKAHQTFLLVGFRKCMQASCALNIYQYLHISHLIKTSMNLYTYPQNSSCTYNMLARESLSKETAEYISKSDYPLPLIFMTSRLEMHHLVAIFDNDLFHFES